MIQHMPLPRLTTIAAAVSALVLPAGAFAQLDEIVVSAQRRETVLQDTPISIHAFSGEDLALGGIERGGDLGIMVPNLVANPPGGGVGAPVFYVRGLPGVGIYIDGVWQSSWGLLESNMTEVERVEVLRGPQGTLFGRNTNGGAINITSRKPGDEFGARMNFEVGSFERRNASAAVDLPLSETVKTKWMVASLKNDGFLKGLSVPRSFGDQDDRLFRADLLWEPADRVSVRLTANDEVKRGTEARVLRITNPNNPQYVRYNVLAGNPEFLAQARAIDPDFPESPFASLFPSNRFTPETHQPGFPGGEVGKWQTRSETPANGTQRDLRYYTLTLEWDISDNLSFRSITSDWKLRRRVTVDFDGSEFDFTTDVNRSIDENFNQEFHLTGSNLDGRINWLAGLYYLDEETRSRTYRWILEELPREPGSLTTLRQDAQDYLQAWRATVGLPPTPPGIFGPLNTLNHVEGEQKALFGEVTVGITEKLDLTLGVRVTDDEGRTKVMTPTDAPRPPTFADEPQGDVFAGTVSDIRERPDLGRNTTNRFVLSYRFNDDMMLYGSWSDGFTETGINFPLIPTQIAPGQCPALPTPIPLRREEITNREVGLRSDWLGGSLRFNATYFDATWEGMRVVALPIDPCSGQAAPNPFPTADGLGDADGWELEVIYAPRAADRWRFDVGIGLISTAYRESGFFDPASGSGTSPETPFAYAPDRSVTVGVQYGLPLANGARLRFIGNYGWMDEYVRDAAFQRILIDENNRAIPEPSYGLLNSRIVYESAAGNWSAALWGTNLTDEQYVNGGFDARQVWGYDFAVIGPRRQMGASLNVRF